MDSRLNPAIKKLAIAIGALFATAALAQATEVFIDVARKHAEHIHIAVPDFVLKSTSAQKTEAPPLGKTAKEVLDFDLLFSGYFRVLKDENIFNEIAAKEAGSKEIDWKLWNQAEVDLLVKGEYYAIPGGQFAVECRLNDVGRQEQLAGIRYTGLPTIIRKIAHKFSDQVVYRFTGEAGVADSRIAFASKVNGNKELFISDYDGQNVRQITSIKSIILSPEWYPFGTKILFTSFHRRGAATYTLDLRSGGVKPLLPDSKNSQSAATWSPDGGMIAFAMAIHGNTDIYTISADGRDLKKLTSSEAIETSPSFSPDGKKIAYVSDLPGKPQIYIMNVDGTNPERFTFSGDYNADPAWSPKGDKIAYASMMDWTFNIIVRSLDGSMEKQLTADAGKNESPSWSPDGRNLTFSSTRTGTRQVYIMNANGENQIRITNMPEGAFSPSWSPRN